MLSSKQRPQSEGVAASVNNSSVWISLNAKQRCDEAAAFERALFERIVAQDDAVLALSHLYQVYLAGMSLIGKPIGTLLYLGPTGSGKTRSVEAAAEIFFGDPYAMIKVDCAEFQHGHEISKLIGSPPGYLGHRETAPLFTQENLNRFHTPQTKLTLVLFDEIEKASDTLWQLLLGILDKAALTLGDNRRIDFSRCMIVMTSNLGAREMSEVTEGKLGFRLRAMSTTELDERLQKIGIESARRKFSPEFMNRLDQVVVFRALTEAALRRILDLELQAVRRRLLSRGRGDLAISCTNQAKDFLLAKGFDRRYGARPLKRAIEHYLVIPLSNLVATRQIDCGDLLHIDFDEQTRELRFIKAAGAAATLAEGFGSCPSAQWLTA